MKRLIATCVIVSAVFACQNARDVSDAGTEFVEDCGSLDAVYTAGEMPGCRWYIRGQHCNGGYLFTNYYSLNCDNPEHDVTFAEDSILCGENFDDCVEVPRLARNPECPTPWPPPETVATCR